MLFKDATDTAPQSSLALADYSKIEARILATLTSSFGSLERRLWEYACLNRHRSRKWKSIQFMMMYGATYRDVAKRWGKSNV